MMILKNVCFIVSMQEMNEKFNEDECVRDIYKILGLEEKEWLPHYVTINECLAKLNPEELEKVRKRMIYGLIRKMIWIMQGIIRYFITHANSLNYNAMRNHYLLTQLADMLLQLYECGVKGLKVIKRTFKDIIFDSIEIAD